MLSLPCDLRLPANSARAARGILLGLALICTPPATLAFAAEGAAPRPRLTVAEPRFESQDVARDSIFEHVFVLANEGDAPLEITQIQRTGNVEIVEPPTRIEAGAKISLKVRVNLLQELPTGIVKQIGIHSNDPDRPELMLELRIRSVEYVQPQPPKARWISVQQEIDGKISSTLTAPDGTAFRVLGISEPPPGIKVAVNPVIPPPAAGEAPVALDPKAAHKTWQVDMTLLKDAPVGAVVGQLRVSVDHPLQKTVPIPLSGFMRPVIAVTPHEVKLGELAAESATKSWDFFVRNFATEPIAVTRVEHDLPGFGEATIKSEEAGRRYRVLVPMDLTKVTKGPIRGTIRIFTDSPKVPFYAVPVDGTLR